jgi:hypothetical protein
MITFLLAVIALAEVAVVLQTPAGVQTLRMLRSASPRIG